MRNSNSLLSLAALTFVLRPPQPIPHMRPATKHVAKPKSLLHPTKGYRGALSRLFKKGTNRRAKPRKEV